MGIASTAPDPAAQKILMKTIMILSFWLACGRMVTAAETQTTESFHRMITKKVGYEYLLALPSGYDAAADKKWPLIIFLHGSGERGTDLWLVAKHGPPKILRGEPTAPHLNEGDQRPASPAAQTSGEAARTLLRTQFIVASPQCPPGRAWDDDTVVALLDVVTERYKIDPQRSYLTGLSLGGYGTWSVGLKYPERFAAIVPICGGGQPVDAWRSAETKKSSLLSLGIWAFHGAKDPTVPLAESERMIATLKSVGLAETKLTIYPEAGHDSWTESYADPELYAWLLRHRRAPQPIIP